MAIDSGQELLPISRPEGIKTITSSQELFSHIPTTYRENNLGKGFTVNACYKTLWDGKEPVVYKEYKSNRDGNWGHYRTVEAHKGLAALEGKYLPRFYASVEGMTAFGGRAVVEEYIEAKSGTYEAITEFWGFKVGGWGENRPEAENQGTVARWLIGYLEGMAEFHKRGFLVSDFKVNDIVITTDGRVIFRDLGNFVNTKGIHYRGEKSIGHDLKEFGSTFLALTTFGLKRHFYLDPSAGGINHTPDAFRWSELLEQAKKELTSSSFRKILEILAKTDTSATAETTERLVGAVKDFLWDRGMRIESEEAHWQRTDADFIEKVKRKFSDPTLTLNPLDVRKAWEEIMEEDIWGHITREGVAFLAQKRMPFLQEIWMEVLQKAYGVAYPGVERELVTAYDYFRSPNGQKRQEEWLREMPTSTREYISRLGPGREPYAKELVAAWLRAKLALVRLEEYRKNGSKIPGNNEAFAKAEKHFKELQEGMIRRIEQI